MAIKWDTLKIRKFWDEETQQFVEVELMVKDIIFFDYLKQIVAAIRSVNK